MKTIKLLLSLLIIFNLISCSITEKIRINENGSGKFSYEIDGSQMMSMMGNAFKEQDSDEKDAKKKNKNKDEIVKKSKSIDSTFTFKQLFANKQDSISKLSVEEQAKIKKMERFSVRTVVNQEQGKMNYSIFTNFATIAELQDVMSPLESMKSISPTGQQASGLGMAPTALDENSSTRYLYDGVTFKKIVSKLEKKKEEVKTDDEVKAGESEAERIKESMQMFYSQSSYKVVYEFFKPVATVSEKSALFSQDRKTITIDYSLKEYMENPEKLNLEVVFEK